MKWEILRNYLTKTGYEVMIIIISNRRPFTIAYPRPKYLVFLSFIRNFAQNTTKCINVAERWLIKMAAMRFQQPHGENVIVCKT